MAVFLLTLSLVLGAYGAWFCPWGLVLWYPAVSAFVLALAYVCNRPGWLGKRADGRMAAWAWGVYGSYYGFSHAVWWVQVAVSGEPTIQEVAPGLWLARRLREGELPIGIAWGMLVDLTAEFHEPSVMTKHGGWRWIPILDAGIPTAAAEAQLEALAARPGPILIHCAQGHGRSGMVAAWLLLRLGRARTVDDALTQIQTVRPEVKLGRCQRKWLEAQFQGREP